MNKKIRHWLAVLSAALCLAAVLWPAAAARVLEDVPAELARWQTWVLYGQEERTCPTRYNDGSLYVCRWPSRLLLDLSDGGGRFSQEWLILVEDRAPLPGGAGLWPENVRVDGNPAVMTGDGDRPGVWLRRGRHLVEGVFRWGSIPEMIEVPPESGLVSLRLNGRKIDFPTLDRNGRLWLQKRIEPAGEADRLEVKVFRLLLDDIPMQVETLLRLNVSGRAREEKISGVLLEGSVPMLLDSPLPARVDAASGLDVQVRPGRWELRLHARLEGCPVTELDPAAAPFGQEVWAFQAQNHLRMVKVEGAPSVDPSQTDVPLQWRDLPVYLIDPGTKLTFHVLRRGDPDPAPDRLNLHRTWWLDFDGGGYTVHDRIDGTMSRQWFLAMNPPGELGRAAVDGEDQLITEQGTQKKPGVELRRGRLNLSADSRYEKIGSHLPAVGWDHDFQSLSGELNLPPGWLLLSASGMDELPGTWLQRWTLLDIFLVLIIAIAVFKLHSLLWGGLALLAVGLSYHEPGAPRLVWLNLLAASALVRVLPDGWVRRIAGMWRLGAAIGLLALAVPFTVNQVRVGLYPQLENFGYGTLAEHLRGQVLRPMTEAGPPMEAFQMERKADSMAEGEERQKAGSSMFGQSSGAIAKQGSEYGKKALMRQDPNAVIQTGPGLPGWQWKRLPMRWSGPVDKVQKIRLWLLSPAMSMMLCFLRVILLAVLICGLIDRRFWRSTREFKKSAVAVAVLAAGFVVMGPAVRASDGAYPPQDLLNELQQRLLKPPECLPECAEMPRLEMVLTGEHLRVLLELHAAAASAVPLPGSGQSWTPEEVVVNDLPAEGLWRDAEGSLWLLSAPGVHRVMMTGRVPAGSNFQISLPLRPRRAKVDAEGWEVQGVAPDGRTEAGVQFTRLQREAGILKTEVSGTEMPPFLRVERLLRLGLEWGVETTLRRVMPTALPVAVAVPLIKGESVTTAGMRVEKGRALVNLAASQEMISWVSALETRPEITLTAPEGVPWMETWVLEASPIWHPEPEGLPAIHHQDTDGQWQPVWRPWPGESVSIKVTRPRAIAGRMVTIDAADIAWTPGERFDKAGLKLVIRASRGGQHRIFLPDGARVQQVRIRDRNQPVGTGGREVVVPLQPGRQEIFLEWHQSAAGLGFLRGPEVRIGESAVNANVVFNLPPDRWILWTAGPRLGPAVLFWTYLAVVILAAIGLGRIRWTPLRTWHWLLLGLGLTQVHPLAALLVVGWLLALGLRKDHHPPKNWAAYDAVQILLVGFTLAALAALYTAVERGLLGIPDMQIMGNGSTDFTLRWTQDRIGEWMPRPWVWSVPRSAFNLLMLLWALWLALSLVRWLRWGWTCFGEGGLWRKPTPKVVHFPADRHTP